MLRNLFKFFSSLKLTVTCLVCGCILVFWGTLAQVHLGLFKAQSEFFRSFLVYWPLDGTAPHIPIFPGGYLIGTVLLINLLAAHLRYYQPGKRTIGIVLIHLGVVLLLVGQMLTDFLARESALHLRIGETKNYSEADRAYELAVIDTTDKDSDKVVAIPASVLVRRGAVSDPEISRHHCLLEVRDTYINLKDMDSTNGTFYDEERVRAAMLQDGSEFRIGGSLIHVSFLKKQS